MKVTTLMVAVLIIGAITGIFSIMITNFSSDYNVDFNNETINSFNKMQEITNISKNVESEITRLQESPNFLSKLDAFFSAGYDVLKTLVVSIDTTAELGRVATNSLPLEDDTASILNNLWWTIIIILIAIGVVLAAVIKWVI